MIVNVARNKFLINKNRTLSNVAKPRKSRPRCNHCGGLVRVDYEFSSCMMCSRDAEHICGTCSYATPEQVAEGKKTA